MDTRQEIHNNLMFAKQIAQNLISIDRKERKTASERQTITREYNQLLSQIDIILLLLRIYDQEYEHIDTE